MPFERHKSQLNHRLMKNVPFSEVLKNHKMVDFVNSIKLILLYVIEIDFIHQAKSNLISSNFNFSYRSQNHIRVVSLGT